MRLAIVCLIGLVISCDRSPSGSVAEAKDSAKAEPAKAEPAKAEPPPPAPPSTTLIGSLYVRTCQPDAPCPSLLQAEGKRHCADLDLGGLAWRLPTIDELESWKGNDALAGFDVFHWSGTAWDQDPGQVWIYDPATGSKTTTKPDRKPFRIRCVAPATAPHDPKP